ncbi:MAG: MATE family efflux transporter, partial [Saprospiraceae bacterium]
MKKINKEILQLAVPNILSNISVPLLSSVDTALMGFEGEASYLGAVGLASMVFNLIYWGFGFLRMGTTGMTAQSYGKKDEKEIIGIFGRGMIVAGFIASVLLVFQIPIGATSMYLVGVGEDTNSLVQEYFNIRIWAAPAALGLMVLMGWFFGMQNAMFPLYLTLIINMVNIVFSWTLVRHYNMGIAGVAYGTVMAQYVGLI